MEKRLKRGLVFLVIGVLILGFNIVSLFIKDVIPFKPVVEEEKGVISNFYTYGNHFNIEGKFLHSIEGDYSLVLVNNDGEELIYSIIISEEEVGFSFLTSGYINDGVNLEKLALGNYYILLKSEFNEEVKYYNFDIDEAIEGIDYYTITKKGVNNNIKTSFDLEYFKLIVARKDLPSNVYDFVVDPGHGGDDPGAINGNEYEKTYNLMIAIDLQKKLEDMGYKVLITREDDVDPGYGDPYSSNGRVILANGTKAKFLISVHLNGSPFGSKERGFELYLAPRMNFSLARLIKDNVLANTNALVPTNSRFYVEDNIYVRSFLNVDLEEMQEEAEETGYELYNITNSTPYYYILRETGNSITGAYVDGRNPEYGINIYRDKNYGIESYIIEYAYLTNNDDLEEISLNYEKYNLSIVSAFRSYLE